MYEKLTARLKDGIGTVELDGIPLEVTSLDISVLPGEPSKVSLTFPVREVDIELSGVQVESDRPIVVTDNQAGCSLEDINRGVAEYERFMARCVAEMAKEM